jgi:hypothetical protein
LIFTTMQSKGRSTSSHVPLSMREEYSCCIATCHFGAWALERATR